MDDATTAFLAFAAIFGGIALYLARLAVLAARLERRLAHLESATGKPIKPDGKESP